MLALTDRTPPMGALRRFWLWWWVAPRIQYDLADVEYQAYAFELFHRRFLTRLVHYFTVPGISLCLCVFGAHFSLWSGSPRWANGALAFAAAASLLHAVWCARRGLWPVAIATIAVLVAMWLGGTAIAMRTALPGARWFHPTGALATNPLVGAYALALIETTSHYLEPVPPPITASWRWMSMLDFLRRGGRHVWYGLFGYPTFFTMTTFISNLHLLPLMVIRLLARFGYRRDVDEDMRARAIEQHRLGDPIYLEVP
jgi:hypothetical protein